jgi:hypothetical protein
MMNYQEKARELLQGRSLIFTLSQNQIYQHDRQQFRSFVEMAAGYGATHIAVGHFTYRYGTSFLPDNFDPYAAWCNTSLGLLWAFPPEELREWIPARDIEQRQQDIAEQVEELRRYGLKATVGGMEPLWLPEEIYRAHPHWRGAQCELGRIARRPYFAPSIDEPEVLDLYRKAVREMSTHFPEIDQMSFMSNDSGAGIAWTPNTYPGMNGPLRWRTRDPGARIAGWINAVQQGAAQAGVTMRVHLHSSGLSSEIKSATQKYLVPGQYLNWAGPDSEPWSVGEAGLGNGCWGSSYPAAGLASPQPFVAGLQKVYINPNGDSYRVGIAVDETHLARAGVLIETFLQNPEQGNVAQAQVLHAAAAQICGAQNPAGMLVQMWANIERAMHAVAQIRQKGFGLVLPFCGVSMRWITRPLVPQPQHLSTAETEYFRSFLFSVNTPEEDANFSFVLGKPVFRGESVMWMARWALEEAYGTLQSAQQELNGLTKDLAGEAVDVLQLEAARIGVLACLVKNAQNVIRYQYALDVAHHPQFGWNVMDYDENILYDQRALQLRKIAREELDNTQTLIDLIESQSEPVIVHAPTTATESVFLLGPDLVGDLRRKMNIMLNYWQDYEMLFPSTKVWEFEPSGVNHEYKFNVIEKEKL